METYVIQPQIFEFSKLKVGQVFQGKDVGVYIKTNEGGAICIKKIAGQMRQEGLFTGFLLEERCVLISKAVFTVGVQ